jgi:outer membrane protein TolC
MRTAPTALSPRRVGARAGTLSRGLAVAFALALLAAPAFAADPPRAPVGTVTGATPGAPPVDVVDKGKAVDWRAPSTLPDTSSAAAGRPEPISDLTSAVRSALLRSGDVGGVRAHRESLRADATGARAAYYPEVQAFGLGGVDATQVKVPFSLATGAYTTLPRAETGLSAHWTLFDFNGREARIGAADAAVDSSVASLRGAILHTAFDTTAAYFEVLRQRELYGAAVFALEQHKRFQERVRRSLIEKAAPLSVAALADTRVAQKVAQLAQREVDLRTTEAGFERMVGQAAGDLVEPQHLGIKFASLDAVLAEALASSPAMAAARKDVEAAVETTKAARADQFGSIGLDLDGAIGKNVGGYDGAGSNLSAKVSYRIAIFDGDLRASRRMSAAAKTSEAGAKLVATERSVEEAIAKSWVIHHKADAARQAAEDELKAQVALLALYEQELDLGTRPLYQLLDVIDAVANARGRVATTRYAEQLAVFAVGREIGALLDMLDLVDTGIDLERTVDLDAKGLERWWEGLRNVSAANSPAGPWPGRASSPGETVRRR